MNLFAAILSRTTESCSLLLLLTIAAPSALRAESTFWALNEGSFCDESSWTHGLPDADRQGVINDGFEARVPAGCDSSVWGLVLGTENQSGSLVVDGGSLQLKGSTASFVIGEGAGSSGQLSIRSGKVVGKGFLIGSGNEGSQGLVRIEGGEVEVEQIWFGTAGGGKLEFAGGSLKVKSFQGGGEWATFVLQGSKGKVLFEEFTSFDGRFEVHPDSEGVVTIECGSDIRWKEIKVFGTPSTFGWKPGQRFEVIRWQPDTGEVGGIIDQGGQTFTFEDGSTGSIFVDASGGSMGFTVDSIPSQSPPE